MLTPYDDFETPCRHCGYHQAECDGPTFSCCKHCNHWTPLPLLEEELEHDDEPEGALA